jgi:UDP-N-acetylglucosamine--N-acetylmuramyl-(pentapeptide) pyrophosphoryl-undecaprenol N-acetylglucosamine transferase
MTDRRPPLVLLAAGGTGGHVFPAEALAQALRARGVVVELATDRRGGAYGGTLAEIPNHAVSSASPGKGVWGKLKAGLLMGRGLMQASALIRHLAPDAVVGFGGYPAVPTVYAAAMAHRAVVLHEQNAVLGRANRLLASSARRIAVAFPEVGAIKPEFQDRVVRVGNPVRPPVAALRASPYAAPDDNGPIRLFVLGGSQGARVFTDVIPAALALLPAELRARLHLAQQARAEDLDRAREALAPLELAELELAPFFGDVPDRLRTCHLAITRAGASTVAELTCVGRPAILVPYPFATDDHQRANAAAVAKSGGGWLLPQDEFTPEVLAERLNSLLVDSEALILAAQAARNWGTAAAAERLADLVLDVIDRKP